MNFKLNIAMEFGKYNIRVNVICWGLHLRDKFPISVNGKGLLSMVLYLVGDESCFLTGTTIYVDGVHSIVRPHMRSFQ
jgi:hypothetical protein